MSGGPRQAAVLGDPIAHSLSPVLHSAAYAALGLRDWRYRAVRCGAAELPAALAALRSGRALAPPETGSARADWAGVSLTMPLKEVALPLVDAVTTTLPALNTVTVAGARLVGHNTDPDGIQAGLVELVAAGAPPVGGARVLLLGAGGTAIAALAALAAGPPPASIVVSTRTPERARHALSCVPQNAAVRWSAWGDDPGPVDLVIATVPAGAADQEPPRGALLDVLYDPWPTPLAAATAAAGFPVVGGLAVLVGQAVRQVALMTGAQVSPAVLRSAGAAELAARRRRPWTR